MRGWHMSFAHTPVSLTAARAKKPRKPGARPKYSAATVEFILVMHQFGPMTYKQIADCYMLSVAYVRQLCQGVVRTDVDPPRAEDWGR